ncbi:hypothetical protein Q3W71_05775 [Micromonospora sp. C28SCA-DRY-2]|uniref:hypothetical protein n=1 Tax=Micromonospora sp. C28SCA-DRY-2 TaxID=3059522 RepID=UPI0026760E6E|nr:hypothetical protein [Micromonospora sp. C28SCA-DRY-2]MDO3701188.1 hypothetical protein [Micromonospora sp. C28SCA-DRY-2]
MSDPNPQRDGAPATLAWLGHPTTVAALVLLVVNDHLLKPAFPGLLTGKLSDVAGLVLAPPLVAVLLTLLAPRLPARTAAVAGLGLVAASFTAVKSSGYVAAGASALRGPDGTWQRVGFVGAQVSGHPFDGRPPTLGRSTPADRGGDPLRAAMFGLTLGVAVLLLSAARAGRRAGYGPWLPVCLASLGAIAATLLAAVWLDQSVTAIAALLALLVALLAGMLFALVPLWSRGAPGRWSLEVLLAGAVAVALAALPLTGWLYGRPAYARVAVLLAVLAAGPGLVLGWRAARLVGAGSPDDPDPPWPAPRPAGPAPGVPDGGRVKPDAGGR